MTYRSKILELYDEGPIGRDQLILELVNYLSESEAKEFYQKLEDELELDYND